jgi:Holliday junction resolvase
MGMSTVISFFVPGFPEPQPRQKQRKRSVTDDQVKAAYAKHQSIWKAGEALGIGGQTVHERLVRLGVKLNFPKWTAVEDAILKEKYTAHKLNGKLADLAASMGRTKPFICRQARRLGLTDPKHPRAYQKVWDGMPEEKAREIMDDFESSGLTLRAFTEARGYGEVGMWKTLSSLFPDRWNATIEENFPSGTRYKAGRAFEHDVKNHLRRLGYWVFISAGSKSPFDVVAIKEGACLLIQCKVGGPIGVQEWNRLFLLAESIGAIPISATRYNGRSMDINRILGPKDRSRRIQPMESFAP